MSKACKLKTNTFVGVSLFSPHYEAKARRLLTPLILTLTLTPYYTPWQPGPMNPPPKKGDKLPHYEHDNMKHQLEFTRKVGDRVWVRVRV